jgi:hypothetical protein
LTIAITIDAIMHATRITIVPIQIRGMARMLGETRAGLAG